MENIESNINIKNLPEEASDIEIALVLIRHIDHPCEAKTAEGEVKNIRKFYLHLAKEQVDKMTNIDAKELLLNKLKEYAEDDEK